MSASVSTEVSDHTLPCRGSENQSDVAGGIGPSRNSSDVLDFLKLAYAFELQGRNDGGLQANIGNALTGHTIFDEWPIWPRNYFRSEAWLRLAFNRALHSKTQTRKTLGTLLRLIEMARKSLGLIDFDHPLTQPVLWIGGVAMPLLILIATFA